MCVSGEKSAKGISSCSRWNSINICSQGLDRKLQGGHRISADPCGRGLLRHDRFFFLKWDRGIINRKTYTTSVLFLNQLHQTCIGMESMPVYRTIMRWGQQRKAEDKFVFILWFFFSRNASHGVEIGHPVTHVIPLNFPNSSERKN